MKRQWISVLLVATSLSTIGVAFGAPASREAVRAILRAKDPMTMTTADWRRLGDDVDVTLIEAASDQGLAYGARQRAIGGLGAVGGARAKEFLHVMLTEPGVAPELLATAVQAYARGFGSSDVAEAQRLGVGLLDHTDWLVRRGAVRALGQLKGGPARAALVAHQSRETHPAVQSALRSVLTETREEAKP